MDPAVHPLDVQDVVLRRGDATVLNAVGAAFERGVVTAVVGPSGCGKTSLLRCMNRLDDPVSGRILLDGTDIRTLDPTVLRRRVGMIFQTPVLFEGGVAANVSYCLDDVDPDRIARALESCGLDRSFADRPSRALSVGQAQRVCIARALIRDPEVLLMDEPTSALDKDAGATIEALIGRLSTRGLTIVLVTHDLSQAMRVAEHAYLMDAGRIVESGPPNRMRSAWDERGPA